MSERDEKREQMRSVSLTKHQELEQVAGVFSGTLECDQENESPRLVGMHLQVQQNPEKKEDTVDPLWIPRLNGYLEFSYGRGNFQRQFRFPLMSGDYDSRAGILALNFSLDSLDKPGKLHLSLHKRDEPQGWEGSWILEDSPWKGTAQLTRLETSQTPPGRETPVSGVEYKGVLTWDGLGVTSDREQFGKLFILGNQDFEPNYAPAFAGHLRLAWELDSQLTPKEFRFYRLGTVSFHPVTHNMVLKGDDSPISLSGKWDDGIFTGQWTNTRSAAKGTFRLEQDYQGPFAGFVHPIRGLEGSYVGEMTNTSPHTAVPKNFRLGIVAKGDPNISGSLTYGGTLLLYEGELGSPEYHEGSCTTTLWDEFASRLVMSCRLANLSDMTLRMEWDWAMPSSQVALKGTMIYGGFGEVAQFTGRLE